MPVTKKNRKRIQAEKRSNQEKSQRKFGPGWSTAKEQRVLAASRSIGDLTWNEIDVIMGNHPITPTFQIKK